MLTVASITSNIIVTTNATSVIPFIFFYHIEHFSFVFTIYLYSTIFDHIFQYILLKCNIFVIFHLAFVIYIHIYMNINIFKEPFICKKYNGSCYLKSIF